MVIDKSPVTYCVLHETLVDPELAMEKRKVISENVITAPDGKKLFTLTYNQVLQSFGVRNWNGRIYEKENTMHALDSNPLIQNDIKMRTWTAEYGHPIIEKGQNELARQMTVFPPNACNTINKYWLEGNLLMGECTTLADGYGEMLRDRILTNYPAMASSRAIGGMDKNGKVLPGYTIVTFDTVIRPSHKEAYQVPNSERVNTFSAAPGNTMMESTYVVDVTKDPSFASFLLSESSSKQQIDILCEALGLDYSSLQIDGKNAKMQRITESSVDTVIIPLSTLINTSYYNIF